MPGNVVAWGSSRDEAVSRLMAAVCLAMSTEATPDAWYAVALSRMSVADLKDQAEAVAELWNDRDARVSVHQKVNCKVEVFERPPRLVAQPGMSGLRHASTAAIL
jgi:P pilus assembly chaperone PapD